MDDGACGGDCLSVDAAGVLSVSMCDGHRPMVVVVVVFCYVVSSDSRLLCTFVAVTPPLLHLTCRRNHIAAAGN